MKILVSALLIGLLFGLGITVSGMINPAKILNFFDLAGISAGTWDPSLAFVMAGGLVTTLIGYRLVFGSLKSPAFSSEFPRPAAGPIDARLVGGAAVFGIGWGIAGFCPGGAIPALGLLNPAPLVFVAAMIAGIVLARAIKRRLPVPAVA